MSAKPSPADPSLPHQVEVARDPEPMREIFQRHLRSLGEEAYEVWKCRIFFIRQRRGLRCLVHYTLRFKEPSTGRSHKET